MTATLAAGENLVGREAELARIESSRTGSPAVSRRRQRACAAPASTFGALRAPGLPGGESLLSVIAATRIEDVQRALGRAGISVDRIVPAVRHSHPAA